MMRVVFLSPYLNLSWCLSGWTHYAGNKVGSIQSDFSLQMTATDKIIQL